LDSVEHPLARPGRKRAADGNLFQLGNLVSKVAVGPNSLWHAEVIIVCGSEGLAVRVVDVPIVPSPEEIEGFHLVLGKRNFRLRDLPVEQKSRKPRKSFA
jgi:hypothetical protein